MSSPFSVPCKVLGHGHGDEEKQWLNAQQASPRPVLLREVDQEGEEPMDTVDNEKMVVNETAVVDETMDEATTMDPEEDVIPGCYMIDIDIGRLEVSNLWIRAEYIHQRLL